MKKSFKIGITISEFGNLAKFYKTYAKGNRLIEVDAIEFEGTPEQHNTGIMTDTIVCTLEDLKTEVTKFVDKNSLRGECFSVRDETGKEVMQEDELLVKLY